MAELITTDKFQYWLLTAAGTFTRVTEDNAFDPSTDLSDYSPSYKDRLNQPSYVTGKKTTVELDIDIIDPGPLQEFLIANEDNVNVPTELVRVAMHRPAVPAWAASPATSVLGDQVIGDASGSIGLYECTTPGTNGATEPAWVETGDVTDGTTKWTYGRSGVGFPIAATGYLAKKAAFNMTLNPLDGPAGEAIKATGTLAMTSDGWTAGTLDPTTATFTPEA